MDIFWTFYFNHLSPLWGYIFTFEFQHDESRHQIKLQDIFVFYVGYLCAIDKVTNLIYHTFPYHSELLQMHVWEYV